MESFLVWNAIGIVGGPVGTVLNMIKDAFGITHVPPLPPVTYPKSSWVEDTFFLSWTSSPNGFKVSLEAYYSYGAGTQQPIEIWGWLGVRIGGHDTTIYIADQNGDPISLYVQVRA